MINLQLYEEHAEKAHAELIGVATELQALLDQGTEEAERQALARQPELEAAIKKHDDARGLYQAMLRAPGPKAVTAQCGALGHISPEPWSSGPKAVAGQWGVLGTISPEPERVMTRRDFDDLSLAEKARFIHSGGLIED